MYKVVYEGEGDEMDVTNFVKTPLKGNGDFRSDEVKELFQEADIIVTNPPFSLFREFLKQIIDMDKKFLILGNNNALTYKETFQYVQEGKL